VADGRLRPQDAAGLLDVLATVRTPTARTA
jgi:hypothetical protein